MRKKRWSALAIMAMLTGFFLMNTGDNHDPVLNPATARIQAIKILDENLCDADKWEKSPDGSLEFDRWLFEVRQELRPYFGVLSIEFETRWLFVVRALSGRGASSEAMSEYHRQLALISIRELLVDEQQRLVGGPSEQAQNKIRLPLSSVTDGW